MKRLTGITAMAALLAGAGVAQAPAGPDPAQEIRRLIRQIAADLPKVDEALLAAEPAIREGIEPGRRRLDGAIEGQRAIVEALQKILDLIPPDQRNRSQSPPPPGQSEPPPPEARPREREQRPDLVPQGEPRPAPQEPKGPEQRAPNDPDQARNQGGRKPAQDPAGETPPQGGNEPWGNLPPFLRQFFRAGEEPRIPEKYQPFWRAFQRRTREQERR